MSWYLTHTFLQINGIEQSSRNFVQVKYHSKKEHFLKRPQAPSNSLKKRIRQSYLTSAKLSNQKSTGLSIAHNQKGNVSMTAELVLERYLHNLKGCGLPLNYYEYLKCKANEW